MNTTELKLEDFFAAGETRSLEIGGHVLSNGKSNDEIYFIKEGYVKAYATNKKDKQFVYSILGKGDVFPMDWISGKRDLGITHFQALGTCEIQVRSRKDTQRESETSSKFAYELLKQFTEQNKSFAARVLSLELTYASERLASCLVSLADRFGTERGTSIHLEGMSLSHQTLGDTSNISREVVSRKMKKLISKNIISNQHQQVVILNPTLLNRRYLKELTNA